MATPSIPRRKSPEQAGQLALDLPALATRLLNQVPPSLFDEPGIGSLYAFESTVTGRLYIGSTTKRNAAARRIQHRTRLRAGTHRCDAFQSAWLREGEEAFEFRILATHISPTRMVATEALLYDALQPTGRLYNTVRPGGKKDRTLPDNPAILADVQQRLDERVTKEPEPDGCWNWSDARGHSRISVANSRWLISRLVWTIAHGPIPEGLFVCHTCDNGRCVRLDHLFLGTPKANGIRGTQSGSAKLTDAIVAEIRRRYLIDGVEALATEFGVGTHTAFCAAVGETWPHVAEPPVPRLPERLAAGHPHPKARRWPALQSPSGEQFHDIINQAAFCREHGLLRENMKQVVAGERFEHRGWTVLGTTRRTYPPFVSPEGVIHHVSRTMLAAFCRQRALDPTLMGLLARGKRKSHKGWRILQSDAKPSVAK